VLGARASFFFFGGVNCWNFSSLLSVERRVFQGGGVLRSILFGVCWWFSAVVHWYLAVVRRVCNSGSKITQKRSMEEMMEYEYEQHLKKQLQPRPSQSVIDRKKMVLKKTVTIHEAAQAGDLKAVQIKLAENGALINLRNPIVRSTCSMFSQDDAFHESFLKVGSLLV
jgi:hypothetical protein